MKRPLVLPALLVALASPGVAVAHPTDPRPGGGAVRAPTAYDPPSGDGRDSTVVAGVVSGLLVLAGGLIRVRERRRA